MNHLLGTGFPWEIHEVVTFVDQILKFKREYTQLKIGEIKDYF